MELLSYQEAANLLHVQIGTVYSWVSKKMIPHIRLGPRLVRFKREEIEAWVEEKQVSTPSVSPAPEDTAHE